LSAERQWLTAVMAVQLGLAEPRRVLSAMSRWTVDHEGEVAAWLESEGVIDGDRRRMLEAMVEQAVSSAGEGQAAQVLESLGGTEGISRSLGLDASALHLSQAPAEQMASMQAQPAPPSEGPSLLTREQAGRYRMEPDEAEGETVRDGPGWHVLRAYDAHLGRAIVVKEFTGPMSDAPLQEHGPACRFVREARVTGQLEHPNIVPVYEVGQRADGRPYFTMKSIRGRSFGEALSACNDLAARLDLLRHYLGLCQAVAYSHDHGVVVRSLEPHHVLLGQFGETVVLEWGQAMVRPGSINLLDRVSLDKSNSIQGLETEAIQPTIYMSPEQAAGDMGAVDERSDVWTLGAILHELLSGRPLFASREEVAPMAAGALRRNCLGAPRELVSICRRALQGQPEDRYSNAKELAADVEAYLTGRRVSAHDYGVRELLRRFARRHRRALKLALFAITFFMLAGAGSYLRLLVQRNRAQEAHQVERLRRADAYMEAARADALRRNFVEARAKLRTAAETKDSPELRGLWSGLERSSLRWVKELGGAIYSLDISVDGQRIAAAGHGGTIFVVQTDSAKVRAFRGHEDRVLCVAFAKGGDRLWSASLDGSLREWDVESGLQIRQLQAPKGGLRVLLLDPLGQWVLAAGEAGLIWRWPMDKENPEKILRMHGVRVVALALHPDGRRVVSAGEYGQLLFWDLDGGEKPKRYKISGGRVMSMGFSRDGRWLLAADRSGVVSFINIQEIDVVHQLRVAQGGLGVLAMDPSHDRFAGGAYDLALFDLESRRRQGRLHRHESQIFSLVFGAQGRVLVSGSEDGNLSLFELQRPGQMQAHGHEKGVLSLDFSPDGRQLASVGRDGTLRLWHAESGAEESVLAGHKGEVWAVRYHPRGESLAIGGMDGSVSLWSSRGGMGRVMRGHAAPVTGLAYSPDGSRLASSSFDKTVRIWDVASGECLAVLEGHEGKIFDVDFDPRGRLLATASMDGTLRLWDAKNNTPVKVLEGHDAPVFGLAFGPKGRFLASGGRKGVLWLWDIVTGKGRVLGKQSAPFHHIDFSPDGAWVAGTANDGGVRLWSVDEERASQPLVFSAHGRPANDVCFSPDGHHLASCGDDGTVRLLEVPSGRLVWWASGLVQMGDELLALRRQDSVPDAAWAQAAFQASSLQQTGDSASLCIRQEDGFFERWDLETDQMRLREHLPGLKQVVAAESICAALAQGRAYLFEAGGGRSVMAEGVDWIGVAPEGWLAVAGEYLLRLDLAGHLLERRRIGPGVLTVCLLGQSLVMGFLDGNVERLYPDGRRIRFANPEAATVTILKAGPEGTIFAGHGDGILNQWTGEGVLLGRLKLHGAVRYLKMQDDTLVAASELGDRATWDLSTFSQSRCDLLEEIWQDVPFIWSEGHLIRSGPPVGHDCLRKGAHRP